MVEDDRPEFPDFIYGTAWKERATVELTRAAVQAGFRAIDTANQPRHYREDLVGEALKALASDGIQDRQGGYGCFHHSRLLREERG